MALIFKRAILTYCSHILVTRRGTQKSHQHISDLHEYTYFTHPIDFFALPITCAATEQLIS